MLGKLKHLFFKSVEPESTVDENGEEDFWAYENPNFLTEPERIARLLSEIESSSPLCTIQVEGSPEEFGSSILAVNPEKNTIVLDELMPKNGNDALLRSRALKLSTFHRGIHLSFNLVGIEIGHTRGISYYKAALPERVFYPQRRRSPRLEISSFDIAFSGIAQRTGLSTAGYIFDLSRGGAGVRVPVNRGRIQRGDKIKNCQINFDGYVMDFDLAVRFVKPVSVGSSTVQIGGFFESISAKSQSKLSYFLASLEREEIRKLKD